MISHSGRHAYSAACDSMDTCTPSIVQAPAGPAEHTAAAAAARPGGPDQRPHWRRRRDYFAAGEHGQQHIGWAKSGVVVRSGIAAMQSKTAPIVLDMVPCEYVSNSSPVPSRPAAVCAAMFCRWKRLLHQEHSLCIQLQPLKSWQSNIRQCPVCAAAQLAPKHAGGREHPGRGAT